MRALTVLMAERHALPVWRLGCMLTLSLASLALSGCATADRSDTLQALAQRHQVCGAAVAVIKNRKLDAIDTATACSPAPAVHAESVFQAASLSKPVFAYAVLKLVAQGKIALDAPVMTYLPQGYRHQFDPLKAEPSELLTDPKLAAITVRMLLNHTSGLPNWSAGPLTFDAVAGGAWRYSGEGYVLLQRAVEAVTGQSLEQVMTLQVFAPLAMTGSSYVLTERVTQNLVQGTKANGAARKTVDFARPSAAFSLYTSAADYGKFLLALLNDAEMLKLIGASPVSADAALGVDWGLGWGMQKGPDGPYIWQWGNNPGYRAFAIASINTGDAVVVLTSSENGMQLVRPMTQKILPGEHKLFQSSILGTDVLTIACNTLRVCL